MFYTIPKVFTMTEDLPGEQLWPEPQKVRFPCEEHGQWFRHPVTMGPRKWEWCDGGETKLLERFAADVFVPVAGSWFYVEVSDD